MHLYFVPGPGQHHDPSRASSGYEGVEAFCGFACASGGRDGGGLISEDEVPVISQREGLLSQVVERTFELHVHSTIFGSPVRSSNPLKMATRLGHEVSRSGVPSKPYCSFSSTMF
jgi:hypothetical protein